jgi:iron complex transport system substrate-binding protein
LTEGQVFAPLPHYTQSTDRLDEIIEEVSAILHPEYYKNHKNKFFVQLPDKG